MDAFKEHLPRLQLLLHEIGYRCTVPQRPDVELLQLHHHWMHHILGPVTSWSAAKLDALENTSVSIFERAYPRASTKIKFVLAKLTAIAIYLDDSLDDEAAYDDIGDFAYRVYIGEEQPNGVLTLYHQCIQELSKMHKGDAALRGLAVIPWFTFIDACLLEKRLVTADPEVGASPRDMGYQKRLEAKRRGFLRGTEINADDAEVSFPMFLRHKSGIGEAYAAAIFKASLDQELPLSRFVKSMPDIIYYIDVMNDLMSFYKERLEGETANFIHLQHQSWKHNRGSGPLGNWTLLDTFGRLCDDLRDATFRVDKLLRLEECEQIAKGVISGESLGLTTADVTMALQWRDFRDGYVSWHFECPRYKLEFIAPNFMGI